MGWRRASTLLSIRLSPSFRAVRGRLYRLDVWQLAERVKADPAAAGFVDITNPCAHHQRCEGYLFWDDVHPTTQAHRRLADAALQVLKAP